MHTYPILKSQHLLSFHKVVDQYFFFNVSQNTTLFLEVKSISVLTILYLEIKARSWGASGWQGREVGRLFLHGHVWLFEQVSSVFEYFTHCISYLLGF